MKRSTLTKILVVLLLVLIFILFILLDLDRFLTLSYMKESQENFQQLATKHPLSVIASYMMVYILVTSLSLPGATVLTLLGGTLFGFWIGTLAVSFASTIGATLACFVSRFLLRDWVQKKLGEKITTVNEGIEREGAFYLFTLRLIPIFPFWAINLVMGLTRMPLRTFYWVSQLGMLAGTAVYVNAGKELGKIDSLSSILSPSLIFSFILLGILPITAKKAIHLYKNRTRKVVTG